MKNLISFFILFSFLISACREFIHIDPKSTSITQNLRNADCVLMMNFKIARNFKMLEI